ncbi:ABC transporter permease, partial [Streptomyces sp. SID5926]|nr:ABC transporter permease [Streptomyces sp. SID5926]
MSALTLDKPPAPAAAPARRTDRTGPLRGVLKRLLTALFVLFCTATVAFFLVRLSGDPVKILLPPDATAEQEQVLRHSLGLDQSLFAQYLDYL